MAEDLSSTAAIHVGEHNNSISPTLPTTSTGYTRKFSNPTVLTPTILKPGRWSIDTSANYNELSVISPSLTLSIQSSVHFKMSTALQENEPSEGSTSLSLPSPEDNSHSHS